MLSGKRNEDKETLNKEVQEFVERKSLAGKKWNTESDEDGSDQNQEGGIDETKEVVQGCSGGG